MARPKCALKECGNEALLMFAGKFICGQCYVNYVEKKQQEQWEDINASS